MTDRLNPNESLAVNAELTSPNGRARLVFQGDGNLVLYCKRGGSWNAHWDSRTYQAPIATQCVMQGDGNLVLYADGGQPVWDSKTWGNPGASLVLQDDENVVVYGPGGSALWSTDTWIGGDVRTGLVHGTAGFRFRNDFPDSVILGVENPGLCGGWTWAALDYHRAGRAAPGRRLPPSMQTELGKYVEARHFDSIGPHVGQWLTQLLNPDDHAVHHWSTHDEWAKLRQSIDAGQPVPIGLGKYLDLTANHQVLATGYRDGKGEKWIYCLDPNSPRVESTLHLRHGQLHWFLGGSEYRGFFVGTEYRPKDPPTRSGVEGGFATDHRAFDPAFYLRIYDDLSAAFGGDHAAARAHWERHGIPEGRRPSTVLDPAYYLGLHADLVDAFAADDLDSAITHWVANGVGEGRRSSLEFDVAWYLANHGDLVAAFGANNYGAAVDHWLNNGLGEGRRSSADFDVAHYLGAYGDLQAAFGPDNYPAAFDHWIRFGKAEGRKPTP